MVAITLSLFATGITGAIGAMVAIILGGSNLGMAGSAAMGFGGSMFSSGAATIVRVMTGSGGAMMGGAQAYLFMTTAPTTSKWNTIDRPRLICSGLSFTENPGIISKPRG